MSTLQQNINSISFSRVSGGFQLTTNLSQKDLQNIFTTIFLVLNFLIAFTGERLIMWQGQRKLLKKKTLPITDLSPFLSVVSTLKAFWTLRRLPGGYFGLLMIASGIFGFSGRYLVNSFIRQRQVPDRCPFEVGVVTTQNTDPNPFTPASVWPATTLVTRAQQAAVTDNGSGHICDTGIFSKVNQDITFFCPAAEDILGYWNCTSEPASIITPANSMSIQTVQTYMNDSSFLYPQPAYWAGKKSGGTAYSDLLMFNMNATSSAAEESNFRFIIAQNIIASTSSSTSNFECALKVTKSKVVSGSLRGLVDRNGME